jgi:DNA repair and recombination protein RAD52
MDPINRYSIKSLKPVTFGSAPFTSDESNRIQQLLARKLTVEHISTRPGAGGKKVHYLQTHDAIDLANYIFEYNAWSTSIVDLTMDLSELLSANRFSCGFSAIVRVTLKDGRFHEYIGYGNCVQSADQEQ